jgi:hypothetical protein
MSRVKVYKSIPKVEMYQPNLEEFYKFMYERHMIYVRRFVKKQPPPWTDNPILRDYKFTNVYRELDRGTIWYKDHVVPKAKSLKDLLWLTTMYRLLNRVETFERVGLVSSHSWLGSHHDWQKSLETLHKTSIVFTNAHLTLPTKGSETKIEKYIWVLSDLHKNLDRMAKEVIQAKDLEDLFLTLQQIECVGNFISYEICCDLMLAKAVPFTENDWVNPGPGCKTGIRLIFPLTKTTEQFQERIKQLQRDQNAYFSALGIHFPFLYPEKKMTLRSIEHSLCEYQKYVKMRTGIGKQRMYFKPTTGIDNGQIVFRFPRE